MKQEQMMKKQIERSEKMYKTQEERKKNGKKQTKAQKKQRKQQEQRRKQIITSMKKKLKHIRLYTQGLYTKNYLQNLKMIINMLCIWKYWKSAIKQGSRYLIIRNHMPHVQYRPGACDVLRMVLQGYVKIRSRSGLQVVCDHITQFIRPNIYNHSEFHLVICCLKYCLMLQCWRAGIQLLFKLMNCKIKCKITPQILASTIVFGYVLLLRNASGVDGFLHWINPLNQQQKYTDKPHSNILKHIRTYNENSADNMSWFDIRRKQYFDGRVIDFVHDGCMKNHGEWNFWGMKRLELIDWQHPFHPMEANHMFCYQFINERMIRGQMGMIIILCKQLKNSYYNILKKQWEKRYLHRLSVITQLHQNDSEAQSMLSLLQFSSTDINLRKMQMLMSIDVEKCLINTQHMCESQKQAMVQINRRMQQLLKRMNDQPTGEKVEWLKSVGENTNICERINTPTTHYYSPHTLTLFPPTYRTQSSAFSTLIQTMALRENLQEMEVRTQPKKGEVLEEYGGSIDSMYIEINLMLCPEQWTGYNRVAPSVKLSIMLPVLIKYCAENVIDAPIELMKRRMIYSAKQNLRQLATLARLHMSDQKVLKVGKSWKSLNAEVDEQQQCVLLKHKQKAPRYEQVPEWYTEYWEGQKQARQQKRSELKKQIQ